MEDQVVDLGNRLRRRTESEYTRSVNIARRTAEVLRIVVSSSKKPTAVDLIKEVKGVGRELHKQQPLAFAVGSIVRRVVKFIRDEQQNEAMHNEAAAKEKEQNEEASDKESVDVDVDVDVDGSGSSDQEAGQGQGQAGQAGQAGQNQQGLPFLSSSSSSLATLITNKKLAALRQSASEMKRAPSLKNIFDAMEIEDAVTELMTSQSEQQLSAMTGKKGRPISWRRKYNVIESINELIEDLNESETLIASQSLEHVHAKELILTFGHSHSVECFLSTCATRQNRAFSVIVAEGAPKYSGHYMARQLASLSQVSVTATTDASIFALMSRVNKVIIGAHALLANGGIIAPAGTHTVMVAAKAHAVPVVVVMGIHKLVPMLPRDPKLDMPFRCYNRRSPGEIVGIDMFGEAFKQQQQPLPSHLVGGHHASSSPSSKKDHARALEAAGAGAGAEGGEEEETEEGVSLLGRKQQQQQQQEESGEVEELEVSALNPAYDYITPDMIALFVTDTGCHSPSYVYRLISEYFASEDHLLD